MARVFLLVAVTVGLSATTGPAAPPTSTVDPEANEPYRWQVVLKAKPHPLVTPAFREQVLKDVRAALQSYLGPFGSVEAVDLAAVPAEQRAPLWAAFDADGWPALAAEPARTLTGVKT